MRQLALIGSHGVMTSVALGNDSTARWSAVLRALRETAGVTQAGWATRLGYGLRTIQRWEYAELAPDTRAMEALVGLCADLGLFRRYERGVLAGTTLTAEWLRMLLADARLAPAPASSMATPLTSFIGRESELAAIPELLRRARLVTLTGTGGVGKTRLAIEVARASTAEFPDGVFIVELASVSDPQYLPKAVAAVLDVRERPGLAIQTTLKLAIGRRKLLLVLDNCEHVLDACGDVSTRLLQGCTELRILATSRVVLGVSGEAVWPVRGLSEPEDTLNPSDTSEAVHLFVDRARAVVPDFAPTAEQQLHLAEICRRLDGLPLAIELAAAWVRVLTLEELAQRLMHSFELLASTSPGRDIPARHRTLKATLDWSFQLLDSPERRLLARLSVFAGGATLEAIEALAEDAAAEIPSVVQSLARLVDASLVQRVAVSDAESRFRLLETVRDFASDVVARSGELDSVRGRHAHIYRDLAEAARSHRIGPDQATWLDRLDREHDNFRAALAWGLAHQDADLTGRIAAALWSFWYHRGHISEGREHLDAALVLTGGPGLAKLRVEMLRGYALLALHHGDYGAARERAECGVAEARAFNEPEMVAEALTSLGFVARVQQDWQVARRALEECLQRAMETGDTRGQMLALHHLGLLALEGEASCVAAWELSERSLRLARQIGDRRMEGNILVGMARVARAGEDAAAARALLATARHIHSEVRDPAVIPYVLLYSAMAVEADLAKMECAVRDASAVVGLTQALGLCVWPAVTQELESWLASARSALGEDKFAFAWSAGQAANPAQTLSDGLRAPKSEWTT